ncbi:MAG TPA: CTP synthase, partial [Epulopiscium sp.]|nr:CTP synthase [Candidatus Epulonipiscium sp.]
QVTTDVGKENVLYIHVTLVPYLEKSGEMKTKPTQHSVKELRSIGIQPDIIVCRSEYELSEEMRNKIALFCSVDKDCVIQNLDAETLYEVPLMLEEEGLANIVCRKLHLDIKEPDLVAWKQMVEREKNPIHQRKIALVGKYVELHDAYLSIVESMHHAGIHHQTDVEIDWIDSELLTVDNVSETLSGADGIIVPGGFGERGVDGKVVATQYARENKVPFFGICLGMQMAVVEFARNVLGLTKANSTEFDEKAPEPVIDVMGDQRDVEHIGGTMRLGAYPCKIIKGTKAYQAYEDEEVCERHRHRYEVSNQYRDMLTKKGLIVSGVSPDGNLVEIIELEDHPWFVGVQFHPEFSSRPNRPHPLFVDFLGATL